MRPTRYKIPIKEMIKMMMIIIRKTKGEILLIIPKKRHW